MKQFPLKSLLLLVSSLGLSAAQPAAPDEKPAALKPAVYGVALDKFDPVRVALMQESRGNRDAVRLEIEIALLNARRDTVLYGAIAENRPEIAGPVTPRAARTVSPSGD